MAKEMATNPAVKLRSDQAAFAAYVLDGLPEAPQYFAQCVAKNLSGSDAMADVVDRVPRVDARTFFTLYKRYGRGREKLCY